MTLPISPTSDAKSIVKSVMIIVVVLSIFGLIGYLAYKDNSLSEQLASADAENAGLRSANLTCTADIANVNKKLADLKTESDARAAEAAAAMASAALQQVSYEKAAQTIQQIVAPSGDDCAATKKLFDTYVGVKK